jgi:hypothetical protein
VLGKKTEAGIDRTLELSAFLLDELRAHLAAVPDRLRDTHGAGLPIFPTWAGGRMNPSNGEAGPRVDVWSHEWSYEDFEAGPPGLNTAWARRVSNLRPLACEASALPLRYAPSGDGGFYRPPAGTKRGVIERAFVGMLVLVAVVAFVPAVGQGAAP